MVLITIPEEDHHYLQVIASRFGLPHLRLQSADVPTDQVYPDIWVSGDTIFLTPEWLRQPPFERQKRIIHEILHLLGEDHWSRYQNYPVLYSTYPDEDTYSLLIWYQYGRINS